MAIPDDVPEVATRQCHWSYEHPWFVSDFVLSVNENI